MTTPFIVRQGDVLLRRIDAIPADAKPVKRDAGRIILAYGEVTGHAHAICDPHAQLLQLPRELTDAEIDERFLAITGAEATLQHEEHAAITIPPGTYQVTRQREYAGPMNQWVAD